MDIRVSNTPEGIVVRRITPSGETAYRKNRDGSLARCLGHKGPWLIVSDFPVEVFDAIWAFQDATAAKEQGHG